MVNNITSITTAVPTADYLWTIYAIIYPAFLLSLIIRSGLQFKISKYSAAYFNISLLIFLVRDNISRLVARGSGFTTGLKENVWFANFIQSNELALATLLLVIACFIWKSWDEDIIVYLEARRTEILVRAGRIRLVPAQTIYIEVEPIPVAITDPHDAILDPPVTKPESET